MRYLPAIIALALLIAACGGSADVAPPAVMTDGPPVTTTPPVATTTTSSTPGEAPSSTDAPLADVDLVTYIAAIEDVLAGTTYEGEALAAPEVFLATGSLFCDQLDGGMPPNEVLTGYLEALTGDSPDEAAEDDLTMAGGILGVGLVTLCPHHMNTVAPSP